MNLTKWADLFNKTGKSILIENCHWGDTVPTADWCPWNYFRSSTDIHANYNSVVSNLQTTIEWAKNGLSRPGCWAYPDMLEIGTLRLDGSPGLDDDEMASHFGAWCIVSSPLILSHDLNNATIVDRVWPLITNTDALRINQAWDGFSGSVFMQASTNITLHDDVGSSDPMPLFQAFNKPIGGGQIAVLVMNHNNVTSTITIPFTKIPGLSSVNVSAYDVWAQKAIGHVSTSWTVTLRTHASAFVILTPQ